MKNLYRFLFVSLIICVVSVNLEAHAINELREDTHIINQDLLLGNGGNLVTISENGGSLLIDSRVIFGDQVQILGGSPAAGEVLTTDANGLAIWEPATGSSEWTDTGAIVHPAEPTVDEVAIGGTSEAGADIFLGVDGTSVFNEQGNSVDFRIEGDTITNTFFVDGSTDRVAVGINDPTVAFAVESDKLGNDDNETAAEIRSGGSQLRLLDVGDNDYMEIGHEANGAHFVLNDFNSDEGGDGTEKEVLFLANSTNIGIGTQSPTAKLNLETIGSTTILVEADSDNDNGNENENPVITLSQDGGGVSGFWQFEGDAGNKSTGTLENAMLFGTNTDEPSQFITNDVTRMTIATNGNVGIGTNSPDRLFEVEGGIIQVKDSSAFTASMLYDATGLAGGREYVISSTGGAASQGQGRFVFRDVTASLDRMTITSVGNIGIGTNSPAGLLHVTAGTSGDANLLIAADTDNNNEDDNPRLTLRQDGTTLEAILGLEGSAGTFTTGTLANALMLGSADSFSAIQFITNDVVRATITTAGNMGLGVTDPDATLEINGQIKITGGTPAAGEVLTADANGLATWEAVAGGGSEWTDTGTIIHPTESTVDEVAIGGTSEAGADIFLGVDGTSVFNEQSNSVDFRVEGNTDPNLLFVDGSADNVGIGTNTPAQLLHVDGGFVRVSNSDAFVANMQWDATGLTGGRLYSINSTGGTASQGQGKFVIRDGTGSVDRFTIDNTGNIGMGTTNPSANLHISDLADAIFTIAADTNNTGGEDQNPRLNLVQDGGLVSSFMQLEGLAGDTLTGSFDNSLLFGVTNNVPMQFFTDDTIRMTIRGTGNVGIGTNAPDDLLELAGDLGGEGIHIDSSSGAGIRIDRGAVSNAGGVQLQTAGSNEWFLGMRTDADSRFRIKEGDFDGTTHLTIMPSSGNVGIGETSPDADLHISNLTDVSIRLEADTNDIGEDQNPRIEFSQDGGNTNAYLRLEGDAGDTVAGTIANAILIGSPQNIPLQVIGDNGLNLTLEGTGNLGLGVNDPDAKLEINGQIKITGGSPAAGEVLTADANGLATWEPAAGDSEWTDTGAILHPSEPTVDEVAIGGTSEAGADIFLGVDGAAVFNEQGNSSDFRVESGSDVVAFIVDGSTDNVGIGEVSPENKLEVAGSIRMATSAPSMIIQDTDSTGDAQSGVITFRDNGDTERGWLGFGSTGNSDITLANFYSTGNTTFLTNSLERMRIDSTGNIGIGTNSPEGKFNIVDEESTSQTVFTQGLANGGLIISSTFTDESFTPGVFWSTTDDNPTIPKAGIYLKQGVGTGTSMYFGTSGLFASGITNDALVINSSGNVGINSDTPSAVLNIEEFDDSSTEADFTQDVSNAGILITSNFSNGNFTPGVFWNTDNDNPSNPKAGIYTQNTGGGTFMHLGVSGIFATGITHDLVIDPIGELGIGTSNPAARLHVVENGGTGLIVDRLTSDGILVSLNQDGVQEGTISVSGNTVSYNAFTGSHYGWLENEPLLGTLMTMTGRNRYLNGNPDSEIIYGLEASNIPNDSKLLGAFLGSLDSTKEKSFDNPYLVMAVGNGKLWVVDKGENLEIGDYLISSSVTGHACKDSGDYKISYVIARVAEPVNWSEVDETIEGRKHKLVSVLFESFVKNNLVDDLEKNSKELKEARMKLELTEKELEIMKTRLKNLEEYIFKQ